MLAAKLEEQGSFRSWFLNPRGNLKLVLEEEKRSANGK